MFSFCLELIFDEKKYKESARVKNINGIICSELIIFKGLIIFFFDCKII